jgi:hypothetical protein
LLDQLQDNANAADYGATLVWAVWPWDIGESEGNYNFDWKSPGSGAIGRQINTMKAKVCHGVVCRDMGEGGY